MGNVFGWSPRIPQTIVETRMPTLLADRLLRAAHDRFVGREEPRSLFQEALTADEPPFFVLYAFGPGGVGKTALLREFRYMCREQEVPETYLDARMIEPNPEAFLAALGVALRLSPGEDPLATLGAVTERQVLLLDTFETLASLERWLYTAFLPYLSERILVVVAARKAPSSAWLTDSSWQALLRTVSLRNFSANEGRTYLTKVGLPDDQHEGVVAFTHGHPLALSLIADTYAQRPGADLDLGADPDVIKTLLDRLVMKVPSPAHRAALEACSMVHYMTEPLLAEMVAMPDVRDLFEWLRALSFIESGPFGLFPHDLARDALAADIRWRNPEWYAELHDHARRYYNRRLSETRGQDQQRVLYDYMYLHRENPIIKPFIDWQGSGSAVPTPASDADWPVLREMVARHEGEASAQLADYWFAGQPEGVLIFRGTEQEPIGFLVGVALDAVTDADRAADPAVDAALRYLDAHAPLRPGERATHWRFWMDAEEYQGVSSIQSLLFLKMTQHYFTTPDLAFVFLPCADPEFWAPFCAYGELDRLPEADYEVGGHRYGAFGHDWRVVPPMLWLDHLAQKEIATSEEPAPEPSAGELLVVLSEEAFRDAVREALRGYARPHTLRGNPLLSSRIVAEGLDADADEAERIEMLLALLHEVVDILKDAPRQEKAYRALDRTYFRPAASQEQAAELLDLPYSTFRRHLKAGVEEITAMLWQREIGG